MDWECQIIKYCHSHDQRASLESTLQNDNAQDMILNSSSYSYGSNDKIPYRGLCMLNRNVRFDRLKTGLDLDEI